MTTAIKYSAITPTLEWSIEKFGSEFFKVRWFWTRSDTVFRMEERSTLERLKGYENIYGDITNYGLAAAMWNQAKIIRGEDKEAVKVHAYRLVARIVPEQRRIKLPIRTHAFARTVGEKSVPTMAEYQEIELPTYGIDSVSFEKDECERSMLCELRKLGLSEPVSVEENSAFYMLPHPEKTAIRTQRALPGNHPALSL